jgi:hypothetical protein
MLTQQQKDQLLHAIAISAGYGVYLDHGTPHCIIGCLARNLGVTIDNLRIWDSGLTNGCSLDALIRAKSNGRDVPQLDVVLAFNVQVDTIPDLVLEHLCGEVLLNLLQIIQHAWDSKANEAMRQTLKDWVESLPVQAPVCHGCDLNDGPPCNACPL